MTDPVSCDREQALKLAPELWESAVEAEIPLSTVKLCVFLKKTRSDVSLSTAAMAARLVVFRDLTDEIQTLCECLESAACAQDPSLKQLSELSELHHKLGLRLAEARGLHAVLHDAYPELYA